MTQPTQWEGGTHLLLLFVRDFLPSSLRQNRRWRNTVDANAVLAYLVRQVTREHDHTGLSSAVAGRSACSHPATRRRHVHDASRTPLDHRWQKAFESEERG